MGRDNMELVLVRKNGPIQSMKFRVWWIYFLFMILAALFMGLGATTYLLYRQHKAIKILAEDSQLMLLRTERLESLVQDQEISQILAQQKAEQAAAAAAQPEKPEAKAAAPETKAAAPKAPEKPEEKPKAEPASDEKAVKQDEKQKQEQVPDQKAEPAKSSSDPREMAASATLTEPTTSDVVGIKDISIERKNGKLFLRYKVANAQAPEGKALGYTTVIARGHRSGKPWIEASPPMRLSPLGRPLNYKRGVPFSVQYHRPIKATFTLNDKKLDRLEFLVYSRDGEIVLNKTKNLNEEDPGQKKSGDN